MWSWTNSGRRLWTAAGGLACVVSRDEPWKHYSRTGGSAEVRRCHETGHDIVGGRGASWRMGTGHSGTEGGPASCGGLLTAPGWAHGSPARRPAGDGVGARAA